MPETLRLPDHSYMRRHDVEHILRHLYALQCVEIVGMSNVGKSALLQLLAEPDVWTRELGEAGRNFQSVYIDCNRMLGLTEQGFCELVLRCLQECSPELGKLPDVAAAYNTLIAPGSEFQVPLSFSRGLTAVLQQQAHKIVLLFDEFDDPYTQIDARVFLNLRALQDRYSQQLVFVTATSRPLTTLQHESRRGEFAELFSHRTWHLAPLTRSDTAQEVRRYMTAYEAPFTAPDADFIYLWSGGHPRMVEGVCRVLQDALDDLAVNGATLLERWQFHRQVAPRLHADEYLTDECRKIWEESTPAEQIELASLSIADHEPNQAVLGELLRRHVLVKVEGRLHIFAQLLADYVQQQSAPPQPASAALWLDTAAGSVLIGGRPVENLTPLEYKLMVLLFQNRDKLIDKYQIVTAVWGESYIDEVDDARIEKLVSRLRQKIEPDPANPRFLVTVRGRGYRLAID